MLLVNKMKVNRTVGRIVVEPGGTLEVDDKKGERMIESDPAGWAKASKSKEPDEPKGYKKK